MSKMTIDKKVYTGNQIIELFGSILADALKKLSQMPSAEKTGRWNLEFVPSTMNFYLHRCSECGGTAEEAMKYCCHCGARMVDDE